MIDGSNPSTQQQCWARLVSIILWHIFILKQCLAVQSRGSSIGNRGVVSSTLTGITKDFHEFCISWNKI